MSANAANHFLPSAVLALAGATLPVFLSELPHPLILVGILASCLFLAWFFRPLLPLLFLFLGLSWVSWNAAHSIAAVMPAEIENTPLLIEASVVDLPHMEERHTRLRVRLIADIDGWPGSKNEFLRLNCYRCYWKFHVGEHWSLVVKLKRPHGFASPGAFDYEKWLFRQGIRATGYVIGGDQEKGQNNLLDEKSGPVYQVWRQDLQEFLHNLPLISARSRGLFLALLIGDRGGLEQLDWDVLRNTGVSHLVAISGLHIGMVMLATTFAFRFFLNLVPVIFLYLPRVWLCRIAGVMAATGYAALAGFSVPTQRALLMLTLFVIAGLLGRETSLIRLLFMTTSLLIMVDPLVTMDTGFWLSFGAVLIIAWGSGIEPGTSWLRTQPRIWLGMAPLLILFFGQISLVAPLANLVAIPVVSFFVLPVALLAGLFFLLGLDSIPAMMFFVCGLVVDLGWNTLNLLAELPMSSYDYTISGVIPSALLIVTGLMVLSPFQVVGPAIYTGLALSLLNPSASQIESGDFTVSFLDVGQGLSVVISTMNTTTVYDTGPSFGSGFNAGDAVVLPYLKSIDAGIPNLLIISHGDNDHIGGAAAVRSALGPGRVLTSVPGKLPGSELCSAGQEWTVDSVVFEFLGPDIQTPLGSNNRSCVLRITGRGGAVLLPGDIEKEVELDLVQRFPDKLDADVLLVPHQGSRTSSRAVFLERVSPGLAIVASGYLNSYGHPHAEVISRYSARGIPVFNTAGSGTVTVSVRPGEIEVQEYRRTHRRFWFH